MKVKQHERVVDEYKQIENERESENDDALTENAQYGVTKQRSAAYFTSPVCPTLKRIHSIFFSFYAFSLNLPHALCVRVNFTKYAVGRYRFKRVRVKRCQHAVSTWWRSRTKMTKKRESSKEEH